MGGGSAASRQASRIRTALHRRRHSAFGHPHRPPPGATWPSRGLTQHEDDLLQLSLLHRQVQLPWVETKLLPPAGGWWGRRWAVQTLSANCGTHFWPRADRHPGTAPTHLSDSWMTKAFSRASRPGPGGRPTAERQPPLGRVSEGPELSMVSVRGSQGGRRGSPCPRIRALREKVLRSKGAGQTEWEAGQEGKRKRPIPGLGGICSPWGILCQGQRGRSCSAGWRGSPIAPGNGHLLGL